MNVAFDPWIPVVTLEGHPRLASLLEVLTNGENILDLAVRPHERVSLMRLFICVAHAALNGPKDSTEWEEVPKRLAEAACAYLKKWADSFELFHPTRPWLQVANLHGIDNDSEKTSSIALLDSELANGNNSTLFDHTGMAPSRRITLSRTALNLLTFQNFSSGGGAPIAQWEKIKTLQVGNPDAPCLSQSMAHCLIRRSNIKDTVVVNLPTYARIELVYQSFSVANKIDEVFSSIAIGRPVWELFPDSPEYKDSPSIINAIRTYLGRMVPISRWIKLIPNTDQMFCCNGFKYDTYKNGFPSEPTAAVHLVTKRDNKGIKTQVREIVKINPSRALWRELSSLLTIRSTEGLGGPLAMANEPESEDFDFHVCAMTRDQASMDIGIESVFHISASLRSNLVVYKNEIENATIGSGRLRRAIETYRATIDRDWNSRVKRTQAKDQSKLKDRLAQSAFLIYWTVVEKNLSLLMAHIEAIGTDNTISTRDAWRTMLFATACEAYKTVCGQETPRQVRAFAEGWKWLTTAKQKDNDIEESNSEEDE